MTDHTFSAPRPDPIGTILILVAGLIILASGFITGTVVSPAPQCAAAIMER